MVVAGCFLWVCQCPLPCVKRPVPLCHSPLSTHSLPPPPAPRPHNTRWTFTPLLSRSGKWSNGYKPFRVVLLFFCCCFWKGGGARVCVCEREMILQLTFPRSFHPSAGDSVFGPQPGAGGGCGCQPSHAAFARGCAARTRHAADPLLAPQRSAPSGACRRREGAQADDGHRGDRE